MCDHDEEPSEYQQWQLQQRWQKALPDIIKYTKAWLAIEDNIEEYLQINHKYDHYHHSLII